LADCHSASHHLADGHSAVVIWLIAIQPAIICLNVIWQLSFGRLSFGQPSFG
jgi:hypothetical protein